MTSARKFAKRAVNLVSKEFYPENKLAELIAERDQAIQAAALEGARERIAKWITGRDDTPDGAIDWAINEIDTLASPGQIILDSHIAERDQAIQAAALRRAADIIQSYFNAYGMDTGRIPLALAKKQILTLSQPGQIILDEGNAS